MVPRMGLDGRSREMCPEFDFWDEPWLKITEMGPETLKAVRKCALNLISGKFGAQ